MGKFILTASTPGTVYYNNKTHNYNYTFSGDDINTIKILSTACLITKVTLDIECASNLSDAPSLDYTFYCGSNSYSGSFSFPQDHAAMCSNSRSVSLSGADTFGGGIASNAYRISYSVGASIMSWFKYWINTTSLTIEYTVRNWVTFKDSDQSVIKEATACNQLDQPVPPSSNPTPATGYRFNGWRSSLDGKLYSSDELPPATGNDVVYCAEYAKIPYRVIVQTVNQNDSVINAPQGQTDSADFFIDGDEIILTAPETDYIASNTETYIFTSWSLHQANDDLISSSSDSTWDIGILDSTAIQSWFTDSVYTIVAKAHYHIVYDLDLSLTTLETNDPGQLGHVGLSSIAILDSSDNPLTDLSGNDIPSIVVSDLWDSSTDSAQSKTVRVYTNDFRLRIYLANTSHTDDYYIASSSTPAGCAVTGFTDNINPTPYDATGAVGNALNYRVVASSSTCSWGFEVLKRYFSITINNNTPTYDGNSYHVVKVYRGSDNVEIMPNNLSRILRGSPTIKIDSSEDATKDTPYNAYFRRGSISANVTEFNISDLKDNYEFTTYATLAPFFTVDTVIDGVSQQVSAYRTKAYTFNIPADTGYKMTATLTEDGTITKTWTQVESISYALPKGVVANTVLNVQKIPVSNAFVHLNTDDCVYGSVEVANNAYDILKTSFQNFTINSITAHTNYEIVSATYEWRENGTPISGKSGYLFNGASPVNQITNKTIAFGGSIPEQSDIMCVISVQFRKNIIYHSHGTGVGFTSERPQSLWYTPVGQAPQSVTAVFAQTADHKLPMLLFGIPEDWIFTAQVNQNLSYTADIVRGTLVIESTGDLSSYHSAATSPWADYKDSVSVVTISDGCTGIDPNMFVDMTALETIVVPDNLVDTVFPLAANTDERLNIYCRSDDEAANYTFTVEDERLVVEYGDNS